MSMRQIIIRIQPEADDFLERRAAELDTTVGQIIRDLLKLEMKRHANAKTPNKADEQLVARLQRLLVPTMADALDWNDLRIRLAALNHELRPAGGGLAVHCSATGKRLCKSSELGFPYARFVRKFRTSMPDHPHKMAHILAAIRDIPTDDADDFDVIESFSPFSNNARPMSRRSAPR